jgi:hypothetical protein
MFTVIVCLAVVLLCLSSLRAVNTLRFVQPTQAITTDGFSDSIWGECPLESIRDQQKPGDLLEYEFDGFKLSANVNAAEAWWADHFNVFGDNGAVVADDALVGGSVNIGAAADNAGCGIVQSQTTWQISQSTFSFWFEARIATSTIADTKNDLFIGLIDSAAVTATSPITATGTFATTIGLVGFFRPETARTTPGTGGAIMNTVYQAANVAPVTVQNDAVSLTAGTFTNLGMYFRPTVNPFNVTPASAGTPATANDGFGKYLLSFYQDGKLLGTQKQIPAAAGTDFPNNVKLRFCMKTQNATGTAPGTSSINRLRIAQVYAP